MTHLIEEYERSAELLHGRIWQLERARVLVQDERTRLELEERLRPLREMYGELRGTIAHLKRYRDHLEERGRAPWAKA
ncbi:MAG: hypothetical protein PUB51_05490 [Oscillospiraceae bacterium]|nr:hypothetical protein [Oscillospiraceae bacterium]